MDDRVRGRARDHRDRHLLGGRERSTAAYLLDADEPAIVETGPSTSFEPVVTGLERLGIGAADLAHIAVTHIHLDHAGKADRRTLPERHRVGTRARRQTPRRSHPPPRERDVDLRRRDHRDAVRARRTCCGPTYPSAGDGDRIELGSRHLEALATPGHAKHHVALADSSTGAVFTGDALGIHPPDARSLRPATPPPDYDLELAIASIERIRERARGAIVLFSHFGPVDEVERICDLATERFRTWTRAVGEASNADSIRSVTTRSTRSCKARPTSLAPTRRRAPRPSSTCRRWRRCPASA